MPSHAQTIRIMIDPGNEPAAWRAEGVLTEHGELAGPERIDETQLILGNGRLEELVCEVRNQINSVLGDAVKHRLYGRTPPDRDPPFGLFLTPSAKSTGSPKDLPAGSTPAR